VECCSVCYRASGEQYRSLYLSGFISLWKIDTDSRGWNDVQCGLVTD
jgi:hypothetical protein